MDVEKAKRVPQALRSSGEFWSALLLSVGGRFYLLKDPVFCLQASRRGQTLPEGQLPPPTKGFQAALAAMAGRHSTPFGQLQRCCPLRPPKGNYFKPTSVRLITRVPGFRWKRQFLGMVDNEHDTTLWRVF